MKIIVKIRNGTKINYIEVKNAVNTCRYNTPFLGKKRIYCFKFNQLIEFSYSYIQRPT